MTMLARTLGITPGANPLGVLPRSDALAAMTNLAEWWTAGEGHSTCLCRFQVGQTVRRW